MFEVYGKNMDGWFETHYYGEKCSFRISSEAHPYLIVFEMYGPNDASSRTVAVFAHGCWARLHVYPKPEVVS